MSCRSRTLVLCLSLVLPLAGFIPLTERTYELDAGNFRLRYCVRFRAWLFGVVLRERCEPPRDHPIAVRLRELGAMDPPNDARSRWVLIKGFKPGVRGWSGDGKDYLRALGETSFGTAVPLPVDEVLGSNGWIRWAAHDPAASRRFWARVQTAPARDYRLLIILMDARLYLERHPLPADEIELEALVVREQDRQ